MKNWFLIIIGLCIIAAGAAGIIFLKNDANKNSGTQDSGQQTAAATPIAPGTKSILVLATDNSSINTFLAATKSTSVSETLDGVGPYTVLAPTNDAFKALPATELAMLLKPENADKLRRIVNYHIISGSISKSQFTNGQKIKTLNGQELTVLVSDGTITFVDAKGGKAVIKKADISASNGVIHTIDAVLLPQ